MRSLALRVVTLSTIWVTVALVVVATLISTLYSDAERGNFERLLSAHLYSLVGSVSISEGGVLQGRPELGELRYASPVSGWYWSVEPLSTNLNGRLSSPSMNGRIVPEIPISQVPFDSSFMRRYTLPGLDGEELFVVETEVVLDNENHIARFRVMGNLSKVQEDISKFREMLMVYLAVFGIGSILINAAVILFGLRPLDKVRQALADIREGRVPKLDTSMPMEIAPLAREMNALIENNRRIVDRSRTQVGNLAHSLKTPLSVLINEADSMGGEHGRVIREQSEAMQVQIEHYLQRARIAAQRDSVIFRTQVTPVLERMRRVTAKLNPDFEVVFNNKFPEAVFAGEREDLEEVVGNLLENGAKWGRSRIEITLSFVVPAVTDTNGNTTQYFEIRIEDDGQGLAPDQIDEALKRGRRVDESKPGTGLGLAIVLDTVREYGGTLHLSNNILGGLAARVVLPLAQD